MCPYGPTKEVQEPVKGTKNDLIEVTPNAQKDREEIMKVITTGTPFILTLEGKVCCIFLIKKWVCSARVQSTG